MPKYKRLVYVLKSVNPKVHYYIGLTSDVPAHPSPITTLAAARTLRAIVLGNCTSPSNSPTRSEQCNSSGI